MIPQDSFYKPHGPEDLKLAFANNYDFDHPNALDMPMFSAVSANICSVEVWLNEICFL
jgi:uridine kinase